MLLFRPPLKAGVNEAYDDCNHNDGRDREPEIEPERELEREPDGTSHRRVLSNAQNATRRVNLTAREKRTIYRMLCLVGVLYLMSIPLLSAFTCFVLGVWKNLFVNFLYPWAITCFFANGVINPYIYCYRNEHFRRRNGRF